MLTIPELKKYVHLFAYRHGYRDREELLSVAIYRLALGFPAGRNPKHYALGCISNCMRDHMRHHRFLRTEALTPEVASYTSEDTEEKIESLCLNQFQEKVLRLRLDGFNDAEIAAKCRRSRQYIQKVRTQIQGRYLTMVN